MNFESFAGQAGIETFYDRDDYPYPNEHYDGTWGISDHYMLNHSVELLSEYQKPFLTGIFTLSSHHPYTIPETYQNRFPKGTLPIHESLGYADESVKQFFENASKTDWYENTLFVITADHTSLSEHSRFQSKLGSLSIPVILFHPNDTLLLGRKSEVTQQIDIMPTILDLLGYGKPFFAFGKSAFDTIAPDLAVAFKQDQHQLFLDSILIGMDKGEPTFVYKPQTDILLHRNLLNDPNVDISAHKAHLRTFMLNYTKALKENKMTYETWSE
jgi:phosphoglycerol transferase MdoB-like AlkP superfamily enzyme